MIPTGGRFALSRLRFHCFYVFIMFIIRPYIVLFPHWYLPLSSECYTHPKQMFSFIPKFDK